MNNNETSSEHKTRHVTLASILAWGVGVILLFCGFVQLTSEPIAAVLLILAALVILPPVNAFVQERFHITFSRSIRVLIFLILLVIGGSVVGKNATEANNLSRSNSGTRGVTESKPQETVIKISAVALSQAYVDNGVAADATYKDKTVEVVGVIYDIDKDILDTPFVVLKGSTGTFFGVQCMFGQASESELAQLSKGQNITLKGSVSGELIGNVIVSGCSVVKK